MNKKMIGILTGAMLFTMVSGTAVWAAEITVDDAVNTALEKAGVAASDVAVYKRVWEFSDGKEKYDVSFLIPGQTKFDYEIDAVTGDVLSGESDVWEMEDDAEYKGLKVGEKVDPEEESGLVEEAVLKAMEDADVLDKEVIVSKAGMDYDNGKKVFDINFFIPGQTKFDYDIDAATGEILAREQEPWEAEDDMEYKGLIDPNAADKAAASGEIDEAAAAAIAIKDAGFAESDVTVTECHREMDDGIDKFNVSFRTADGAEYDYDIDAISGAILEKDMEYDD